MTIVYEISENPHDGNPMVLSYEAVTTAKRVTLTGPREGTILWSVKSYFTYKQFDGRFRPTIVEAWQLYLIKVQAEIAEIENELATLHRRIIVAVRELDKEQSEG